MDPLLFNREGWRHLDVVISLPAFVLLFSSLTETLRGHFGSMIRVGMVFAAAGPGVVTQRATEEAPKHNHESLTSRRHSPVARWVTTRFLKKRVAQ